MSTIKATTLSNLAGSKTVPTDTVVDGSAKAWVNFNGTGTVAIRRAFNVSSITDNGTGDYTVNFTNAMVDANYCTQVTGGGTTSLRCLAAVRQPDLYTTSQVRAYFFEEGAGAVQDPQYAAFSIFS